MQAVMSWNWSDTSTEILWKLEWSTDWISIAFKKKILKLSLGQQIYEKTCRSQMILDTGNWKEIPDSHVSSSFKFQISSFAPNASRNYFLPTPYKINLENWPGKGGPF
jgi:hypothetical protein